MLNMFLDICLADKMVYTFFRLFANGLSNLYFILVLFIVPNIMASFYLFTQN